MKIVRNPSRLLRNACQVRCTTNAPRVLSKRAAAPLLDHFPLLLIRSRSAPIAAAR